MTVRRSVLAAIVLGAAVIGLAACKNDGPASVAGEMSLGQADAPVTVVEYASVTCGHCAQWNQEIFPEFKRRYVDTGQVRYVLRELPAPASVAQVAVAGFLTARCASDGDAERYFALVDAMMRNQQTLVANPRGYLLDTARSAGMSEAQFNACVSDEAALNAMNDRIREANDRGVTGTPYFLVNDQVQDNISLEGFEATIRPLAGGAASASAPAAAPASTPAPASGG